MGEKVIAGLVEKEIPVKVINGNETREISSKQGYGTSETTQESKETNNTNQQAQGISNTELKNIINDSGLAKEKAESEYAAARGEGQGIKEENLEYWVDQNNGKDSPYEFVVEYANGVPTYRYDEIQLETGERVPLGYSSIEVGEKVIAGLVENGITVKVIDGNETYEINSKQQGYGKTRTRGR